MSYFNCECKTGCVIKAIILSVVIGVITAALSYTAAITVTPAFLWVLFGIGVIYLLLNPLIICGTKRCATENCICSVLSAHLIGLIGLIITSLILLGITFAATSLLGAVITGALLGFFTLSFSTVACITKCVARCHLEDN